MHCMERKSLLWKLLHICNTLTVVIILFMVSGCKESAKSVPIGEHVVSDSTLIQIDVDPVGGESYTFDSLINDISFVKLQTTDNCLIGSIHQILCSKDYIFVMDAFVANAVYCFDKQGRFIRQIGKTGQGPGEYTSLCKMCLTDNQKQLVLYDWNVLHYYDLYGNHVKDVHPNISANDIEVSNPDFMVGFKESGADESSSRNMLVVYDSNFKPLYKEFPSFYTSVFHLNDGMHPLRSCGTDIFLRKPWTHSIYKIDKDRCYEKYRINIKDGGYPKIPEDMTGDAYTKIIGTKVCMEDYVFLKDYALFYFRKNGFRWSPFVAYSHRTKKAYKCNGMSQNPLFFAQHLDNTPPVCYDESTVLIPQSATTVMRMKSKLFNSPLIVNSQLERLYDGLTEDSNPVLFLFRLKSL